MNGSGLEDDTNVDASVISWNGHALHHRARVQPVSLSTSPISPGLPSPLFLAFFVSTSNTSGTSLNLIRVMSGARLFFVEER